MVGIPVADGVRVLIAPLDGVGRDYPLSIEKLCPVLSWYVVQDWREGCERCIQILRYGGMGHTMSVHSQNDEVVLQFGLKKPAFRICVNTPTTHGSIGLTTGLDPAMTLGCGGWGGNSTSDNISSRHLLNLKRVAYGIRPAVASPGVGAHAGERMPSPSSVKYGPAVPQAPAKPAARGISADELRSKVDRFLSSRGYKGAGLPATEPASSPANKPVNVDAVAFVCEDDVRRAMQAGTTILLGEKTIVTPAARDLGTANNVFAPTSWPR